MCVEHDSSAGSIHSPGNGVPGDDDIPFPLKGYLFPDYSFPVACSKFDVTPKYQISTAKMTIIPVAPYSLATSFIFIYSVSTEDFPFWWVICTYKFHNVNTPLRYTNADQWQVPGHPIFFTLPSKACLAASRFFLALPKRKQQQNKTLRGARPWKSLKITVHNDNGLDPRCLGDTLFLVGNPELESKRSWSKRSI